MYYVYMESMKPQDIAVLLKLLVIPPGWSFAVLSSELLLSQSEVHGALRRMHQAGLYSPETRVVNVPGLEEFLISGIRYVFFISRGELTRGIPTSIAAPPLITNHFPEVEIPPVWSHPLGMMRGYAITPLYKRIPEAALRDREFYELLALTDALREQSARVRGVASKVLRNNLKHLRKG